MPKTITLSEYVKRRTGVALGASGSMTNMLRRSLGAHTFHLFWQYWNPIWGYYLSRRVMRPLSKLLPVWLATTLTFAVSGALHDVAITLATQDLSFFFTLWFFLMSLMVLGTKKLRISTAARPWLIRALMNISLIAISFYITRVFT